MGPFMAPCMPVTWKYGSVDRVTPSRPPPERQAAPCTQVAITERWVCMQPLGAPVVPEL